MNNEVKNNDRKKIYMALLGIATLFTVITSSTFAYFQINSSNTVITGTSATVNNVLDVTQVLPTAQATTTGVMVPQLSYNPSGTIKTALKQAVTATTGCVDANNNIVCKVYKISYKNGSTADLRIKPTLTFTTGMTNLKWYILNTANNEDAVPAPNFTGYSFPSSAEDTNIRASSYTNLGENQIIASNKYRYWYIVIWIEEQNADQYTADGNKTFDGEVKIMATDSNGVELDGLTSTFRG